MDRKLQPISQTTEKHPPHTRGGLGTGLTKNDPDQEKEYLIRALSHDINAQLMILEYSNQICGKIAAESENHRWDEAHLHVKACVDGLKRFVNDLICYAKTGMINMEPEETSLQDVVDEVLYEQKHLLDQNRVDVIVSPVLPKVYANRLRVKQILNNLIRNAAIHGCDSLKPMLSIRAEYDGSSVVVFVQDNGKGIPEPWREKIFEPGTRVPGNDAEGNGIGLAIVQKVARYYGGDATVDSNPLSGTTFQVILPALHQKLKPILNYGPKPN